MILAAPSLAGLLGLLGLGPIPGVTTAPAQDARDELTRPPGAEGPLSNDCFLPTGREADRGLAGLIAGDDALRRARTATRPREADRLFVEAFEAWHGTLQRSGTDASIWADADGARRLTAGLHHAVAARLRDLSPGERERWRSRFDAPARSALDAARERAATSAPRGRAALALVEAQYPGTDAALHASVSLADIEAERGRPEAARAWLDRAEANATGADDARSAIGSRRTYVDARAKARRRGSDVEQAWHDASALQPASGPIPLPGGFAHLARRPLGPGEGVRPGLAFYRSGDDGRVAVQTWDRVHLFSISATSELKPVGRFDPPALLAFDIEFDPFRSMRAPGWPLLPAADDGNLILVHGRTTHGRSNALMSVRPADGRGLSIVRGGSSATLRWAMVGNIHVGADRSARAVPELAELIELEFQPGPVVIDDLVVVQAREYDGETRAWLIAFERDSGAFAWKALIATGSDLKPDFGRSSAGTPRLAAEPLAAYGGRVFAGTNLGAGALVEALDGRPIWSVRIRRRAASDTAWLPTRPIFAADAVVWSPFDSDRLYSLDPRPIEGASAFRGPTRPIAESTALIGGNGDLVVVQGRSGRERTLSERGPPGTARRDALYLGPEENFPGRGLVSARRAACCTNRGVYLFDRARELYLLDYTPLANADAVTSGGDLYADAHTMIVLGRAAIWSFRVH